MRCNGLVVGGWNCGMIHSIQFISFAVNETELNFMIQFQQWTTNQPTNWPRRQGNPTQLNQSPKSVIQFINHSLTAMNGLTEFHSDLRLSWDWVDCCYLIAKNWADDFLLDCRFGASNPRKQEINNKSAQFQLSNYFLCCGSHWFSFGFGI